MLGVPYNVISELGFYFLDIYVILLLVSFDLSLHK